MEFGPIFRAMTRNRARFVLIVLEVALTLALVVNCVTMILGARAQIARSTGYDEENLILVRAEPIEEAYRDEEHTNRVTAEDTAALRAMPGVKAVSQTSFRPWAGGMSLTALQVPGHPERENIGTQIYPADPHIFDALGVEVSAGRTFTAAEFETGSGEDVPNVPVVLSRKLAEVLFPGGDAAGAVGKEVRFPGDDGGALTVVGVFEPFYKSHPESAERALIVPDRSGGYDSGISYLVRTEPGQSQAVLADLEATLLRVDAGRLLRLQPLPEVRRQAQMRNRILIYALNAVMALLLFVTGLGIVGLTSFSVAERRRQIGTRRALGATRNDVLRYFLLENWVVTTCGVVLGVALAVGLNVGLVNLVEGQRLAWPALATGVVLLWGIGLVSALGPALRAAQVPPAIATRNV